MSAEIMAADPAPPTKFVVAPNPYLMCGKCQEVFKDAVISTTCGHTFCRRCISAETGGGETVTCPVDGVVCRRDGLVVNRALQGQVDELEIHCRYGLIEGADGKYTTDPTGCPDVMKLGDRWSHEEGCEYQQVPCPNDQGHCGKFRRRDLDQHLRVCMNVCCVYREQGCEFVGRHDEVNWHSEMCGYRPGAKVNPVEVENLRQSNAELKKTLKLMSERVEKLESSNQALVEEVKNCVSNYQVMESKYGDLQMKLEHAMKKRRPSSNPPSQTGSLGRTPSMRSLQSSVHRIETWTMPFQFKCIGTLRGHSGCVHALTTSGNILISGGEDRVLKVWDLDTLAKGHRLTLQGHTDVIMAVTMNTHYLYSTGVDRTVRAWRLDTGTEECQVDNAHADDVIAMVCTDDFVFTSSFSNIHIWEAERLKKKESISGLHHWVRSLALSPDKDRLYSGSHNTIETWDAVGEFTLKGKLNHKFGSIYSLVITQEYIIAGTYNQNIQMFDIKTQQHKFTLSGHIGTVTDLQVAPSGRFLFSSSTDTTIQIWNLENQLPIQSLTRHENGVNAVLLYGDLLLSAANDSEIKVFKHFSMI